MAVEAARNALHAKAKVLRVQCDAVRRETVEGIHDMRVGSRRLRSVLQEIQPAAGHGLLEPFRARVKTITESLGRPRELDVMIAMLNEERAHTQGAERATLNAVSRILKKHRRAALQACQIAADAVAEQAFEEELRGLVDGLRPPEECHIRRGVRRLKRKYKRLVRSYEKWNTSKEDAQLHRLRIAFKKMRYVCEFYAPLYDTPFQRFVERLKEAQELLGDWQDCRVLIDEMEAMKSELSGRSASGLFGLMEVFRARRSRLQKALKRRMAAFFRKTGRKKAKYLFNHPRTICPCAGIDKETPPSVENFQA